MVVKFFLSWILFFGFTGLCATEQAGREKLFSTKGLRFMPLPQQIDLLQPLLEKLRCASSIEAKLKVLDEWPPVSQFLEESPKLHQFLQKASKEDQLAIKALLAIGQGPIVFHGFDLTKIDPLLKTLREVEVFYSDSGGIIGYHTIVLKLIAEKEKADTASSPDREKMRYLKPHGLDLTQKGAEVAKAVRWGIEQLPKMAEIYPVGGAGDRLNLCDESTGEPLPAAELLFNGYPLLEGLIRDLQGREYLFYKLFGHQEVVPIALMTSLEENNDAHIRAMCTKKEWFGRPPESFKLFMQPLVPVITEEGIWAVTEPMQLLLKPGGHGVLWKLAEEKGVFDWLKAHDRLKALVRQINNPVAGVDLGLLALMGIGFHENKAFGFASCPRLLKTAEGTNVLVETELPKGYDYCLTNIEYTEFKQKGIDDIPSEPGSPYSAYPSNTNILFVDLEKVRQASHALPIPGMLVNMKNKVSCLDAHGHQKQIAAGRLESTMQNVADAIVDHLDRKLSLEESSQLSAFITFNTRPKTLSVTKTSFKPGAQLIGTPEGCLFEMMENSLELLRDHCGMDVPSLSTEEEFLKSGPAVLLRYHPALGPLYTLIGQKIRGGSLEWGAELQLEIAELEIANLRLQGSLLIEAKAVMGKQDVSKIILYGPENGKCILRNVTVLNQGIDRKAANAYWKNQIVRQEELHIVLHGSGEFFAQDVTFKGTHLIEVPHGHRMRAVQKGNEVEFKLEKISSPTWAWQYTFDHDDEIKIKPN